jgi:hypothetical protein
MKRKGQGAAMSTGRAFGRRTVSGGAQGAARIHQKEKR